MDIVPILTASVLRKQAQDVGSPGLLQRALAHFLGQGHFAPHLRNVPGVYRERRQAAVQAMRDTMPDGVRWTEPDGGLWLWIRFGRHVDTTALYADANSEGVTFAPGVVFFAANAPGNYLRLSYGAETPARIREGIATIARLADKQTHGETSHRAIL